MNTNFFNQIAQLGVAGNLHLTIAKGAENSLIVSVMLQNEQCGDNAKNIIPPLNLRGTAEELDSGFFENITAPIRAVSGLMVNMEAFMKQVEIAKSSSAREKEKSDKAKKEGEAKNKNFKDAMLKVDELEKEGRYKDAWMKVPDPAAYPDYAETIRKRKTSLSAKFAPDLFADAVPAAAPPQEEYMQEQHRYPAYSDDEMKEELNWGDEENEDY